MISKKFYFQIIILGILGLFTLSSCKKEIPSEAVFLVNQCFQCHYPENTREIAPSFSELRATYKGKYPTEQEFTAAMLSYVQDPKPENMADPAWQNRFGVMPKFTYKKEDLEKSIKFIYKTDFNSPEWKSMHQQVLEQNKKLNPDKPFAELGKEIADKAKAELGKNLLGAIQSQGTLGAISFCNERAIPLTQEISQKLGYKLKRVSDKPRNPLNEANAEEKQIIELFKIQLKSGQPFKPITRESGEVKQGFYPIVTNQMCLQCHGNVGTDISGTVYSKIQELYPKDKAIAYGENEIRGLWVVEK